MKMLKRWLAFFVVVVLLIGVAFNSRGPLIASQVDGTTEGTADPSAASSGEEQQQVPDSQDQQAQEPENIDGTEGTTPEEGQQAEDQQVQNPPEDQAEPAPETEEPKAEEEKKEDTKEEDKEAEVHQDAMELTQQMTDENGVVICNVKANIPEGTFEANTSDVTMEVGYVAADTTEQIKALMSRNIPEDKILGEFFIYDVKFKVNGEQVEPGKEITITFEQSNFLVKDVKKASTFYYNEANSPAGNGEAEIVKITQRADKIQELQNAGQSIDTVDDYDLSEISLREDGTADMVVMEGRRSTVYGCYLVEEKPVEVVDEEKSTLDEDTKEENKQTEVLKYEDDDVSITVSAETSGIIPKNTELRVVPIKKDETDTEEQYKEVEEQLNKKAETEDYEIAGFLAYDICFINDKGEEVEPNGNVKVIIDYKNEILPEEVETKEDKEIDVTVMHLEEDEKGEVKEVVDMNATDNQESVVETTDDVKVKKAEFVTDSFSYFTVTWKVNDVSSKSIEIKFVDIEGYEIHLPDDSPVLAGITLDSNKVFKMSDINRNGQQSQFYNITDKNGESYTFKNAVNEWHWKEGSISGTIVTALKYENGQIKWQKEDGFFKGHDSRDAFYFMYVKDDDKIKELPTESDNINISLYNYNSKIATDTNPLKGEGFGFFSFYEQKDGKCSYGGEFTNSGKGNLGLRKGIVKSNLENGAPVLNSRNGSSMGYLFGKEQNNGVTPYEGLSGLFQKDVNGYYYYDSLRNAAVLDGNKIKVYSGTLGTKEFKYGNFLPFNNEYLDNGINKLNEIPIEQADVWFGMNVGMNFYQPRDGRINNQDMVFEFRGDDDIWVFIDGMLVLDIGGIHGQLPGSINFSSGEVSVNGEESSLSDCYYRAYKERNLSETEISDRLDSTFNKVGDQYTSFKNYSSHTFEFFYLERGGAASNCKIKFNMQKIPEESVMVTKEVVNENDETVDYSSDIDFRFSIKKNNELLANANYTIYKDSLKIGTGTTNESGKFTLKHGQSAVFEGFKVTDKYEVKELGAYLDGYQVSCENIILTEGKETEGTTTIESFTTGTLEVDKTSSVVFKNKVTNTGKLSIKKTLSSGSSALSGKEFPVQVKLQGKPYKGNYTKNGTLYTVTDGMILIKSGDTVQITGLPFGTSFEVLEQQDGSYLPAYTIDGEAYDKVLPEYNEDGILINDVSSASGKIAGDCTVGIENSIVNIQTGTTSVKVEKKWVNPGSDEPPKYELPEFVEVTLYEDTNQNGVYDEGLDTLVSNRTPIRLNKDNQWTGEWVNLPADVDYVVKESYPEGYKLAQSIITNSITEIEPVDVEDGKVNRQTANDEMKFDIGKNNILLVKEKANQYFLWTPIDLKLNQDGIVKIVNLIQKYELEGAGNFSSENVGYRYGDVSDGGGTQGISLTEKDNGWTLNFSEKRTWAMFWNFSYNRVETITLNNTIEEIPKKQISVNKVWQGDTESERPNYVIIQLYKNGKPTEMIQKIDKNMDWQYTFEGLDYYTYDSENDRYIKNVYTVKETQIGNEDVNENGQAKGYQSSVNQNEDGSFTVINSKEWQIVKVSDKSKDIKLKDAVFKLWTGELNGNSTPPIYGKSNNEGIVKWYRDVMCQTPFKGSIPDGIYTLTEEQAPSGYSKSGEIWTITIANGGVTKITSNNGNILSEQVQGKFTYYFNNASVFSLPSAGGPGIFWYTAGGTLLMCLAGLLALYKNKRKRGANISV